MRSFDVPCGLLLWPTVSWCGMWCSVLVCGLVTMLWWLVVFCSVLRWAAVFWCVLMWSTVFYGVMWWPENLKFENCASRNFLSNWTYFPIKTYYPFETQFPNLQNTISQFLKSLPSLLFWEMDAGVVRLRPKKEGTERLPLATRWRLFFFPASMDFHRWTTTTSPFLHYLVRHSTTETQNFFCNRWQRSLDVIRACGASHLKLRSVDSGSALASPTFRSSLGSSQSVVSTV